MSSNSICTSPERRQLLRLAVGLAKAAAIASLSAIPGVAPLARAGATDWRAQLPQAQALGGGDLTWFGLRIYRSISRQRLTSTSIDEIRRLSRTPIPAETLTRWQAALTAAFVDVSEGDELIGVFLPGRGMQLYDRQRLLAELDDQLLARAFFDIWLNPDSRDQALRRRLLGASP